MPFSTIEPRNTKQAEEKAARSRLRLRNRKSDVHGDLSSSQYSPEMSNFGCNGLIIKSTFYAMPSVRLQAIARWRELLKLGQECVSSVPSVTKIQSPSSPSQRGQNKVEPDSAQTRASVTALATVVFRRVLSLIVVGERTTDSGKHERHPCTKGNRSHHSLPPVPILRKP